MSGSKDNDTGLMSNAGLVRYFDSESKSTPKVDPRTVLVASFLMGVAVMLASSLLL